MLKRYLHVASIFVVFLVVTLLPNVMMAQLSEQATWAMLIGDDYQIVPNIPYTTANNYEAKLDLYLPNKATAPSPVLVYFHGGGWRLGGGSKELDSLLLLPYLELGFAVVNVEYRPTQVSLAPAAVEDSRCALRWVFNKAKEYKFDTTRIVVSGISAGGNLALNAALLTPAAGLDTRCPGEEMKVAAVVSWLGITDVYDQIEGPNKRNYAIAWLGSQSNRDEIARRVSPINHIRPGVPPILTIHGDADPVVPYSHAVRLHEALKKAGVSNQLLTIPGGKHGGFTHPELLKVLATIREFLTRHNVWKPNSASASAIK